MRITYYALKNLQVGDDLREPGDLVPEAQDWKFKTAYLNEGALAPVLVATLPEEQQVLLLEWEEAQNVVVEEASSSESTPEPDAPTPDDEPDEEATASKRKPRKKTDTSEKVA